jgi:hypothetical protein
MAAMDVLADFLSKMKNKQFGCTVVLAVILAILLLASFFRVIVVTVDPCQEWCSCESEGCD